VNNHFRRKNGTHPAHRPQGLDTTEPIPELALPGPPSFSASVINADISAGEAHPSRLGASPNFQRGSCLRFRRGAFPLVSPALSSNRAISK